MPNRDADRETTIKRWARRQAKAATWLRQHGAHDHARDLVDQAIKTVEAFRRGDIASLPN